MVGNWVFFFEGILRVGVSVATIVYQVQPFIVLVAGAILFQERLGFTKVLLFLVALFGLILATGIKWNMIDAWLPFGSRIYAAGSDSLCGRRVGRQGPEIG